MICYARLQWASLVSSATFSSPKRGAKAPRCSFAGSALLRSAVIEGWSARVSHQQRSRGALRQCRELAEADGWEEPASSEALVISAAGKAPPVLFHLLSREALSSESVVGHGGRVAALHDYNATKRSDRRGPKCRGDGSEGEGDSERGRVVEVENMYGDKEMVQRTDEGGGMGVAEERRKEGDTRILRPTCSTSCTARCRG